MNIFGRNLFFLIFAGCAFITSASGQVRRELSLGSGGSVEVINRFGRVEIAAVPAAEDGTVAPAVLRADGKTPIAETELEVSNTKGSLRVEARPSGRGNRVDILLTVPERTRVRVSTADGEVRVTGDLELVEATTETGTIAADVPTDDVRYEMIWRESRPRFLSDFELEKVKEKSGGKFSISGKYRSKTSTETDAETIPDRKSVV